MKKTLSTLLLILCTIMGMAQTDPKPVTIKSLRIEKLKPFPIKSAVNPLLRTVLETTNGVTYKVFYLDNLRQVNGKSRVYKGILVIGSGNDENNPSPGSLDGDQETRLCQKAAQAGYIAAIVQYKVLGGMDKWNANATKMGQDYNSCIEALSAKYGVDKSKSVVAGISYASFMLLTDIAQNSTLSYCKGLLAPCGATSAWAAQNAKIPVYNIVCSGNYETGGDPNSYAGERLMTIINPAVRAKSEGITDTTCNGHCAGDWTDRLFNKMVAWLN